MTAFFAIGLMSGTSMDGIDAALIKTDGYQAIQECANVAYKYDPEFQLALKLAEYAVKQAVGDMNLAFASFHDNKRHYLKKNFQVDVCDELHQKLDIYFNNVVQQPLNLQTVIDHSTDLHAQVVQQLLMTEGITSETIDVVGYHGQALFHKPAAKITIQIGDGARLAKRLRIPVVNNFRQNDVLHGGQGAPFAPIYHQALARRDGHNELIVVNCGGIANITLIGKDVLLGFDTGPGNGLIDRFVKQRTQFRDLQDTDGKFGSKGRVQETVLAMLWEDLSPYLNRKPPKSLDINDFALIPTLDALSLEDGCATLEAFTAKTIVSSLDLINDLKIPNTWVLAGGGWHNPVIRHYLNEYLDHYLPSGVMIKTAAEMGWNNDALEAQLFAYLAVRRLLELPISFPYTTQVVKPLTGGDIHTP